ncbi:aliphatic sulfonate ABC transporter substrate-binding protein [uncultured Ilyobacter sp.]|uniref:taurine ABC transporter substrate-binding protein n=1 Tax=uncultured Ilyobacter sp. TaxID=544433 RepID=UPI0029BFDECB|nr:aliphatic sulfonate ABC transporter substrate-binding protein [uncultured Ilyobacter sp.]
MSYLKKLVSLGIMSVLFFSFVGCGGSSSSKSEGAKYPEVVNIGTQKLVEDEMLAIHEGFIEKYFSEKGVKVNFVNFDAGSDVNVALASGSIDFGNVGSVPLATAASLGLDLKLIWLHALIAESEALCVKDGSGIKEVKDLAGKTLATPVASTSHLTALKVLEEAGIKDQVTILDMKPADIVAAWSRGDIEAAYVWQPALGELTKDGTILKSTADLLALGTVTADTGVVRTEFAEAYPDLVACYVAAMIEAGDVYRNSVDDAANILASQLNLSKEVTLSQINGNKWLSPEEQLTATFFGTSENLGNLPVILKETADFLRDQEAIESSPELDYFESVVDPSYIEEAIKILGR